MIGNPWGTFLRIFRFIGIDTPFFNPMAMIAATTGYVLEKKYGIRNKRRRELPGPILWAILNRNSFKRKSGGRRHGEEHTFHHYRKGIAGDWPNHFPPRVKDAFKKRYQGLLVSLNYASDNNW